MIPAFLSIDVEPDGFQLTRSSPPDWNFGTMIGFLQRLRAQLQARCGQPPPRFGWYFRTDPQIAEIHGRATHVMEEHADSLARLAAQGDYFGVHMHPIRWSAARGLWVHDYADREWVRYATRYSLERFAEWAGSPARRFRTGGGFINNDIVAIMDEMNVDVDLSLEPVTSWGVHAKAVPTGVDESPIVGTYLDCREAPRKPFRPSIADFRIPDHKKGRRLRMVPVTTSELPEETSFLQRLGQRFSSKTRPAQVLFAGLKWPSPTFYWDLAERQLNSMRRPYLSLAIRSRATDDGFSKCELSILDGLLAHPLSKRLAFVDPLDAVAGLI